MKIFDKKKERDYRLSFIICCNKFGWTKASSVSRKTLSLITTSIGIFILISFLSIFLSYRFYGELLDIRREEQEGISRIFDNIPFGKPTAGKVTSGYGYRKSPFSVANEFHRGMDFGGKIGSKVTTTADGIVEKAGYSRSYGKYVVIKHKKGYKTLYGHLSKINVNRGQKVIVGEKIGELGSTGRSTGPHLHYEIIKYGQKVNPKKYVFTDIRKKFKYK